MISKGYENCLLLVTKAIDKIMTGEDVHQEDLVISKLLGQEIEKYKSLFPHVSAAIQLLSNKEGGGNYPTKGDTIQYIYTDSQHKNPLCRVVPLEVLQKVGEKEKDGKENGKTLNYDKDKYREMILDAAETVLGYFGFNRTVYSVMNILQGTVERKRNGMTNCRKKEQKIFRQRCCNKGF